MVSVPLREIMISQVATALQHVQKKKKKRKEKEKGQNHKQ
jgi:hypothetical protein